MAGHATPLIHPSNAEALRAWDGAEGDYWTQQEETFDRSVAGYQRRFLDAARITGTDHVLDIGCGTGQTTREAAAIAAAGSTLGVDLSSAMIARARQRAAEEGLDNVRFEHADAQVHPFVPRSFDVAVSRTGAMFFGDPVAAFANIAAALRPGGRLALLVWQSMRDNEWIRHILGAVAAGRELPAPPPDAPGPFALADPHRVRTVLTAAGFTDIGFDDVREPMFLGADTEAAYRFALGLGVVRFLLRDLDDTGRERARAALRATIEAHATADGVFYPSAAWIVTARRR